MKSGTIRRNLRISPEERMRYVRTLVVPYLLRCLDNKCECETKKEHEANLDLARNLGLDKKN
jgi:hypothetical protein